MIERPKRSVTFFFVPLIDVLILLFCIFLLMPFVSSSETAELPKEKIKEPELPKDVRELRTELERVRRENDKLKAERGNLSERLSVKVLEELLAADEVLPVTDVAVAEIALTSFDELLGGSGEVRQ